MSLADDLKPIALEALYDGVGAAIKEFADREPDMATKAEAAANLLQQALDMLPEEELHKYLTSGGIERAELAFRLAKAAALQGA